MYAAIKENARKKIHTFLFVAMIVTVAILASPLTGQTAPEQFAAHCNSHPVTAPQLRSVAASVSELATGKLLIASRRLRDPNFAEAVILLLEHSKDGAMGVLINRPTTITLATVLAKVKALKKRKDLVYIGGPVGRQQMLLLARTAKEPQDSKQVLNGVYLIASETSLQQLVGQSGSSLTLRAYAGYAGWAPEQLDAEVSRGDWHIQSTDATVVFDTPAEQLWPDLIRRSEFEWTHSDQTNELTAHSLY